jgi:uncharacterized protein YjbI with pentapeptide repeats
VANFEHLDQLKKGVESWNHWRRENPHIIPNLKNIDCRLVDLSFADLRGARLNGVKFIGARLVSTRFSKADLSNANLSKADLRYAEFKASNLSKTNLSGANLSEANLNEACLTEADLSKALLNEAKLHFTNLSKANLSKADLKLAVMKEVVLWNANLNAIQALGTNFSGAIFTGACLDNWKIDTATNLNDVQCDYVYLRKGADLEFVNRFPSNRSFQIGEFTTQFKQSSETAEILFTDGIDWKALFQSFQKLKQYFPGEVLELQAFEKKSSSAFAVRLEISQGSNKESIERNAKRFYEEQRQCLEVSYRVHHASPQEIESNKQQNTDMMEILKLLAIRPINIINNVEATAMSNPQEFTNNIHGNVANFANQVSDHARQQANQHNHRVETKNLVDTAKEIQALLDQLSQTYPTNTPGDKYALAKEAIQHIENNLSLGQRILSAINAGGASALEQFLNHPAASFVIGMLEDWQKTRVE